MQIESNINPVAFLNSLDDDEFLQFHAAAELRTTEIRARKKATAVEEVNSKIKFFGMTLADLHALKTANRTTKAEGGTIAAKFYDPVTGAHWTGNGHPKEAFKDAHAFDESNPNSTPKRLDQYLIRDHEAKEIATKIKKDVRTISKNVIKYADLIAEASNQQVEQTAA